MSEATSRQGGGIADRLRWFADTSSYIWSADQDLLREAAAAIDRLTERDDYYERCQQWAKGNLVREREACRDAITIATLRKALTRLFNEVDGAWKIGKHGIRRAIGNTNYACVQNAMEEANAALTTFTETDADSGH